LICKDENYGQLVQTSDYHGTGYCADADMEALLEEWYDYYLEMWEEYYGEEDDDESSASTIQTGLAAVTMAVML